MSQSPPLLPATVSPPESQLPAVVDEDLLPTASNNYRGINIGGHTVTQSTEHLPEDQKLLVRWLYTLARDLKWTWEQIEEETGFDSSTLTRIFLDTYRQGKMKKVMRDGKEEKVPNPDAGKRISLGDACQRIAKFKEVWLARQGILSTGFLETEVWGKVEWTCRRAFLRQKIGFIYGESQIGKSSCLIEYARRNNSGQTAYLELPPSAGVQLMTRKIAEALHVPSATCYERLIDDVVAALDKSKLLIIDEIHRLETTYQKGSFMRCMETLRYIHDQTKCGLVLCGTPQFAKQFETGTNAQFLKQLARRGLYVTRLPDWPSQKDLDLVTRSFGLEPTRDDAAHKRLTHLAKLGGFGVVFTRLQDASEIAAKKKERLHWKHFLKACDLVRKNAMSPQELTEEAKREAAEEAR